MLLINKINLLLKSIIYFNSKNEQGDSNEIGESGVPTLTGVCVCGIYLIN